MRPRGACAARCPRAPRRGEVGRCAAGRRVKPASFARRERVGAWRLLGLWGSRSADDPAGRIAAAALVLRGVPARRAGTRTAIVPGSRRADAPRRARVRAVHLRLTRRFVRSRHEARAPAPPRRRRARRRMPLRRRTGPAAPGPRAAAGCDPGLERGLRAWAAPASAARSRSCGAARRRAPPPTGPRTSGPAGRTRRTPSSTSARSRRRSPPPPCSSWWTPAKLALDDRAGDLLPGLRGPAADATVEQLLLHTSGLTGTHGDDHEPLTATRRVAAIGRLERRSRPARLPVLERRLHAAGADRRAGIRRRLPRLPRRQRPAGCPADGAPAASGTASPRRRGRAPSATSRTGRRASAATSPARTGRSRATAAWP